MESLRQDDNIIALNRDVESYVIQSGYGRSMFFKDKYKSLQFVHFSDVHNVLKLWNRIVEYINHYGQYISFALHTGDYCANSQLQHTDFYTEGIKCTHPILNCVGNHDTCTVVDGEYRGMPKERTHELLFGHTEDWEASFMDAEHPNAYYRDFPESGVRLIVLDLYYDEDAQVKWLTELLDRSVDEGISVITAMHEPSAPIEAHVDTAFNSLGETNGEFRRVAGEFKAHSFEPVIAEFIAKGGKHICNLCGHLHHDMFGYTASGVLNIAVECATSWHHWCDGRRVEGTRTYDCFNVMSVDVNLKLIKLVRIGNDCDNYLRTKKVLCYDYLNRKIIN